MCDLLYRKHWWTITPFINNKCETIQVHVFIILIGFFFHFLTSYIIYVMVWDNETNLKNYQLIIHCIISCVTATNWNFFFISLTSNVKPHFCHFRQDLQLHHWKDFNILKVCYTNDICKWFRNTVLCLQKGNNSI